MKREKSKSVKSKRQKRKQAKMNRKIIDQTKTGRALMMLRGNRTQIELAQALNISDSAIRMYESGNRTPEDDIKIAYSKYFEKSVDELFFMHLMEVDCEDDDDNDEPDISGDLNEMGAPDPKRGGSCP